MRRAGHHQQVQAQDPKHLPQSKLDLFPDPEPEVEPTTKLGLLEPESELKLEPVLGREHWNRVVDNGRGGSLSPWRLRKQQRDAARNRQSFSSLNPRGGNAPGSAGLASYKSPPLSPLEANFSAAAGAAASRQTAGSNAGPNDSDGDDSALLSPWRLRKEQRDEARKRHALAVVDSGADAGALGRTATGEGQTGSDHQLLRTTTSEFWSSREALASMLAQVPRLAQNTATEGAQGQEQEQVEEKVPLSVYSGPSDGKDDEQEKAEEPLSPTERSAKFDASQGEKPDISRQQQKDKAREEQSSDQKLDLWGDTGGSGGGGMGSSDSSEDGSSLDAAALPPPPPLPCSPPQPPSQGP